MYRRMAQSLHSRISKLSAVLLIVVWLVTPCQASNPDVDLASMATAAINPLKALDIPVVEGIHEAISEGNDDLRDRLEQLHAIIQEALATADQILKTRIDQLDSATKNRLAQALQATTELATKLSADYQEGIHQVNLALEQRILQFQQQVGNIVAALPVNFDPILNVDPQRGLATVRGGGEYTTLMISGVGLFKDGTKPQAFLLLKSIPSTMDWVKFHTGLSQDAIRAVDVISYSMGLITLQIKNSDIPRGDSPAPLILELHLRRGGTFVADMTAPRVPLRICDSLPHYRATLFVKASGDKWDKREIPVPGAQPTKEFPDGFYIETCGRNDCNAHLAVCAIASDGFDVDQDPVAGYQGGLRYGPHQGGDRYRAITPGQPHPGCVMLYVDGREGPSNVWIAEVYERQKREISADPCSENGATGILNLVYEEWRQTEIDLRKAIGPCGDNGLSKSPVLTYRLRVEDQGNTVWIVDLTPNALARSEDGRFEAKVSSSGLLSAVVHGSCRWAFEGAVSR